MKNIFNLMKETPEQREKRQSEEKPVAQNKANRIINDAIKEADKNDANNSSKGDNKKAISQ